MLDEFYDANDVSPKERIPLDKDVLLVVPEKGYDVSRVLAALSMDKTEVAVTWPKYAVDLLPEICAVRAKRVIQVGKWFYKKFEYISDASGLTQQTELPDDFVNLHHHDEYSIKDGLGSVKKQNALLKSQRRSFCCVTNHGSVGGWIKQYNECKKSGMKAIFGMEAYVSNYRGDDPEEKKKHRSANHLVLLATTMEGFENVIKIHNDAQMDGFYYSPRVNVEAIQKWGKGIVGTSACMAGEIASALMADDKAKALEVYKAYSEALDKFYIEIQVIEFEMQREANRKLIEFAREVGAPLILACDSHYLEPEHSETHDLLLCIRQRKTIMEQHEKDDVWSFDVKNLYYRNASQMRDVFENGFVDRDGNRCEPFKDDVFTEEVFREAMGNTRKVAVEAAEIELDSTIKLPRLYPDGAEVLEKKAIDGLSTRGFDIHPKSKEYAARLKYELGVIIKMGWADYFLVMDRIVSDTVEKFGEWSIGYGRGSAAGSLVSYCLGLTDIDPVKYGLLFERFLDEGRPDPPDIDTDFDPGVREWVKKRIVEVFGKDNVCSIGTYQTYKTRAVILDVARALGEDVIEANSVTKRMDPLKSFDDEEGESHKVDDMGFDELCEQYPELDEYFALHEDVKMHAEVLRNQVKNMGTHAGGVIISDMNLKGRIPVLYDKAGDEDRKVISAWAEAGGNEELSSVGLVKFDLLGLNNLPVISDCVRLVEETKGIKLLRKDMPIDDREAIKMGSKSDLVGIFQLENPATKPVADDVVLESLSDVSALTSLIRPGPRDMGMDKKYASRKRGEPYDSIPMLKEIMAETYGVMTYQEQMMKISRVMCGFDGPMSNKLRKACATKIKELMDSIKEQFIDGAQPNIAAGKVTQEEVEDMWELIASFAKYSFNKSHAVCYSAISTVEMWLKYNYPVQYVTALLNNTKLGKKKHGKEVLVWYMNYARKHPQIKDVMCADINKSKIGFTIEDGDKIRFSLGHIKNVASQAKVIESFQPIADMQDFYDRVKTESIGKTGKKSSRRPNKKVMEHLIAAGSFDCFGTRNEMMAAYYKARPKKKGEEAPEYTDEEWYDKEKEVTGMCLSIPPLYLSYEKEIADNDLKMLSNLTSKRLRAFGKIEAVMPKRSKAGNQMFIVQMGDGIESLSFFVFQGAMQYFRDNFREGMIVGMPLSKFDDGDSRFFDDRGEPLILPKTNLPQSKNKVKGRTNRRDQFTLTDKSILAFTDGDKNEWFVKVFDGEDISLESCMESITKLVGEFGKDGEHDKNEFFEKCFSPLHKVAAKDKNPDNSERVRKHILAAAEKYGEGSLEMEKALSWLYLSMISQENESHTQVGSRMMMLAVYSVLFGDDGSEVEIGKVRSHFAKVSAKEIAAKCKKSGF